MNESEKQDPPPSSLSTIIQELMARNAEIDRFRRLGEGLCLALDEFSPSAATVAPTRDNAKKLFGILHGLLEPATRQQLGLSEGPSEFETSHPACNFLKTFIDLLDDLENGKTHKLFEPCPDGATASLRAQERKQAGAWLELVDQVQILEQTTWREAAKTIEARFRQSGTAWKERPITVKVLKGLRDTASARKRNKGK